MNTPLEVEVGRLLRERKLRLALAESCTGGFLSHRLTNIPGASAVFWGGWVTYDNAAKESFYHTLKAELVSHEHYRTRAEARASLFEYIEAFYNRLRLHSTLGYMSPADFERACTNVA